MIRLVVVVCNSYVQETLILLHNGPKRESTLNFIIDTYVYGGGTRYGYIWFGTTLSFIHPLRDLQHIPLTQGEYCISVLIRY